MAEQVEARSSSVPLLYIKRTPNPVLSRVASALSPHRPRSAPTKAANRYSAAAAARRLSGGMKRVARSASVSAMASRAKKSVLTSLQRRVDRKLKDMYTSKLKLSVAADRRMPGGW